MTKTLVSRTNSIFSIYLLLAIVLQCVSSTIISDVKPNDGLVRKPRLIAGGYPSGIQQEIIPSGFFVNRSTLQYMARFSPDVSNFSFCSGALVTLSLVLTAAHCVDQNVSSPYAPFTIILGDLDTDKVEANEQRFPGLLMNGSAILHPKWDSKNSSISTFSYEKIQQNDIAVYKLPREAKINVGYVQIIGFYLGTPLAENSAVKIAGWGESEENAFTIQRERTLQEVEIPLQKCGTLPVRNSEAVICYGTNESFPCKSDAGGPVITYVDKTQYLVGVHNAGNCNSTGVNGIFGFGANLQYSENQLK
ncbi:unnamed protein product [Notodromas monacha]|uniref:Peptidase S1 domain-containing protein n=1 Tax=Notodromas monacha TaxID=399045 RepID=A0A7R9GEK9_9CRUS|nr:unnamed protein product [Notodromas monacha]CAG0918171.1 unnamed protein product [Notodromas monacha]